MPTCEVYSIVLNIEHEPMHDSILLFGDFVNLFQIANTAINAKLVDLNYRRLTWILTCMDNTWLFRNKCTLWDKFRCELVEWPMISGRYCCFLWLLDSYFGVVQFWFCAFVSLRLWLWYGFYWLWFFHSLIHYYGRHSLIK